jgi:cobalamin biosynthesis protein CbiG
MPDFLDLTQLVEQRAWRAEDPLALTIVSQHLYANKPVVIVQEIGAKDWHPRLPDTATILSEVPSDPDPAIALMIITDRAIRPLPDVDRLAILRPPTLTLGVACQRNVTHEDLDEAFRLLCRRAGFSSLSLTAIGASARRQRNEGLEEFAEKRRVPLLLYPDETLVRSPLTRPGKMSGTCAVSAILAAGSMAPIVESTPFFGKLTLALARRKHCT